MTELRAGLTAELVGGEVVLTRWHDVQGIRLPTELARFSFGDLGLLVCLTTEGWNELNELKRAQRRLWVAGFIERFRKADT